MTAIRIVFAFGAEQRECERYNKAVDSGGSCVTISVFSKLFRRFRTLSARACLFDHFFKKTNKTNKQKTVRDTRKRLTVSAVGIGIAIMIMFLVQALALYYGSTLLILGMYAFWHQTLPIVVVVVVCRFVSIDFSRKQVPK